MRRLALIVAGVLILAGCASSAAETFAEVAGESDGGGDYGEPTPMSARAVDVDLEIESQDGRRVIRRANLEIHAADTRSAFDQIVRIVESAEGFVADATIFPTVGEDDQPAVAVTLRIPANELNEVLLAIKAQADEVVTESQNADDVTDQFVDLEAQLRNYRALEVELRALLTEVRQQEGADPSALLEVFNELSLVRGQIEQTQGRINYLADLTSLATVIVGITQTPVAAPIVQAGWQPMEQVKDSLRSLVDSLQGLGDWAINFALFTLPVLLLTLAIPLTIGLVAYRKYRNREPGDGATSTAPAES